MSIRIGVGAGFAGDRYEPASELIQHGDLDFLVYECLAERTISLAQVELVSGRGPGFDSRILQRLGQAISLRDHSTPTLITNAGAANPKALAQAILEMSKAMGASLCVAALTGDDVLDLFRRDPALFDPSMPTQSVRGGVVSANAYLGVEGLVEALDAEADIVVTGRVADAALFLAPLVHQFKWKLADWDILAHGAVVGHLLECGGQLTGGYFDDAGRNFVPGLAKLGFPFAVVEEDGTAEFQKLAGSGGRLDRETVRQQLFYEVSDPERYITPDVIVDMSHIDVTEFPNVPSVHVKGARGSRKPNDLKVSVGVGDGWEAVAEISYAGPSSLRRGKRAADVIMERWNEVLGYTDVALDVSFIGVNSCVPWKEAEFDDAPEVRVRFSTTSPEKETASVLLHEVEALYTNGPAGGGGVTGRMREVVGVVSSFIPRDAVEYEVEYFHA